MNTVYGIMIKDETTKSKAIIQTYCDLLFLFDQFPL
jgi:hypothetical protein